MDREKLALEVARILVKHLPASAGAEAAGAVAADLVRLVERARLEDPEAEGRRLAVLTVMGQNRAGIVHAFSEILAEHSVDIVDINQTIVHGNFAMMMVVDPSSGSLSFSELKAALKGRGDELGVNVYFQYEDLMRAVNRI
jgi:ACT domain-containing protein